MSTVKGLKELINTLERIPKEMDGDVEAVLEANAAEIVADAKRMAPVDTGKLRQSQGFEKTGDKTYVVRSNATGLAPYDVFVEYGTRFQQAKAFFFPAVFKGRSRLLNDLKDLLNDKFGRK